MESLVKLRGVTKTYQRGPEKVEVLHGIDLDIPQGDFVALMGPSGSGKSPLCRAINRLEPIDSGTISLDGQPLPAEGKALARLRADVRNLGVMSSTAPDISVSATSSRISRPSSV